MPLLSPLLRDVLTPPGSLDHPILPLALAPHGLLPKPPTADCEAGVQRCTSLGGVHFLGNCPLGSRSGLREGEALGMQHFGSPGLQVLIPSIALHHLCITLHPTPGPVVAVAPAPAAPVRHTLLSVVQPFYLLRPCQRCPPGLRARGARQHLFCHGSAACTLILIKSREPNCHFM